MQRNNHQYKVGDKILVKHKKNSKHELEFMGILPITQINDNGTVRFQKGIINDAIVVYLGNGEWTHEFLFVFRIFLTLD